MLKYRGALFPRHAASARLCARCLLHAIVTAAIGCLSGALFVYSAAAQQARTAGSAPLRLLAGAAIPRLGESLPDAPLPFRFEDTAAPALSSYSSPLPATQRKTAPEEGESEGPHTKYIEPGMKVPRLTARNKVVLGLKDGVSPLSMMGWLISSAYEQVTNNGPNYGQSGSGYAQRLGAAAVRDFTEGTFGDSVLSPLLHEDPRFYRMGKGHPLLKRLIYAGSRGIITRTNSGRSTINIANIGGNLGGALLTDTYYPDRNTTCSETMETFGTSVGGSALGFAVTEFLPDLFHAFHLLAPGY